MMMMVVTLFVDVMAAMVLLDELAHEYITKNVAHNNVYEGQSRTQYSRYAEIIDGVTEFPQFPYGNTIVQDVDNAGENNTAAFYINDTQQYTDDGGKGNLRRVEVNETERQC